MKEEKDENIIYIKAKNKTEKRQKIEYKITILPYSRDTLNNEYSDRNLKIKNENSNTKRRNKKK